MSIFDAINDNNLKLINEVLTDKADLHVYEPINEDTPLHFVVRNKQNNIIPLLLENNAPLNARNKFDDTPLHVAVLASNETAVRLLLESGADKELRNNNNQKPMDLAKKYNHVDIISLLDQNK